MAVFAGIAPAGEGPRKVFDSENTWDQQVTLVRGEGEPATGKNAVDNAYDYTGTALARDARFDYDADFHCNY